MKKLFAGFLGWALAGAPLPADAAEWYPSAAASAPAPVPVLVAAPVWAGFYAGVNLGYGWSTASDQLACGPACVAITGDGPFGGVSPEGWLGGVQAGYNWQGFGFASLVVGIETDFQPASVYGQGSDVSGDFFHSRLEMLGTVRGRIGYAWDCTLLYFTGGFAYGAVLNEAILANGADYTTNPTATGYVLGGGVEYKFWHDLSLKVEYQYVDLGKNNPVDATTGTAAYTANGGTLRDNAYNTVRVGLNWWPFGTYVPPPLK